MVRGGDADGVRTLGLASRVCWTTAPSRHKCAGQLDSLVCKGESPLDYKARMMRQISSLDWHLKGDDEPEP